MAYGNGAGKDTEKRLADLGLAPMTDDLAQLRKKSIATMRRMARAIFPEDIVEQVLDGKAADAILMPMQAEITREGVNNIWAEKCRIMAKGASLEQWKRGQKNLFGRFKNVSSRSEKPMKDGSYRLLCLPEEWNCLLSQDDVDAIQSRADECDFRSAMTLFRELRDSDAGFTPLQADALRAMHEASCLRWGCPEWRDDAIIQLHLDSRCIKGTEKALSGALTILSEAFRGKKPAATAISIASHIARGPGIPIALRLSADVSERMDGHGAQFAKSLVVEIGPEKVLAKVVIMRPKTAPSPVGFNTVLGEDFGFVNTSSIVVARAQQPITEDRLAFVQSNPGKKTVKAYLEGHFSSDEIEILESLQFSGRNFLARIRDQADKVDALRSEIDRGYNRLGRIRSELNQIAGREVGAIIPAEIDAVTESNKEQDRYARMHGRFFRLLTGIGKLKARRRAVYAAVAGLKKSWFGHIANAKAKLAEKYGAVVVREDLSILTIETDDPAYKGRTFNKMINNGSKGQYIRRSDNKLAWRGIPSIVVPSYYSSTTDWRYGCIDKAQRHGERFTGKDGRVWDADMHAGEMLARWLFLRPKLSGATAPL